ncbi:MAG TPA: haloacid dehalogenase type II [Candidatus Limnocylindrales bacterium]|nr:haloacid dehalogenase type II [Candidatus Limnocylindrales bacterium]
MKNIQTFVFDAYGTLFDVHSVVEACNRAFPGRGEALSQLWRAKQLEYTWLKTLMGHYEDFWQVTEAALTFACKTLNLQAPIDPRPLLMTAYLRLDLYPEVLEALTSLASFPLSILSNGSPRMLQAVVQNAGLKGRFVQIISVEEVKAYKPSPRVYELAPQKLGIPKEAICFVSSNSFDVIGAKAFGFQVCWVNRTNAPLDELGFLPDAQVSRLTELKQLVED